MCSMKEEEEEEMAECEGSEMPIADIKVERSPSESRETYYEVPIVNDLTMDLYSPQTSSQSNINKKETCDTNVKNKLNNKTKVKTKAALKCIAMASADVTDNNVTQSECKEETKKLLNYSDIINKVNAKLDGSSHWQQQLTIFGQIPGRSGKKSRKPPEELLPCDDCGKTYASAYSLRKHMLIHSGEEPFQCDVCMKKFTQKKHHKKHMLIHSDVKNYECQICLKRFTYPGHLKAHLYSHNKEKQFQCDVCLKRFTLPSNLKTHKVLHTLTEKQYQCELCQKRFSRPYHLKDHMLLHGDRPFACAMCGRTFTTEYHLKKHESYHTDQRHLKCSMCPRKFNRLGDLKRHQRTHSGEKPFRCEHCPKKFSLAYTLRRHQMVHDEQMSPEDMLNIAIQVEDPNILLPKHVHDTNNTDIKTEHITFDSDDADSISSHQQIERKKSKPKKNNNKAKLCKPLELIPVEESAE